MVGPGDGANQRRANRPGEAEQPRIERIGRLWHIRALGAARQILQARGATTQAGFTAEAIPADRLRHQPILISDGPVHDEQRRKVGRFFAPRVVAERYADHMHALATGLLDEAERAGGCRVDDLALLYTVGVTRQVVGLTESSVRGMSRRLVSFFNQPEFDLTKPNLGRTRRQWARAAFNGLSPVARFYVADVRPAIRKRRRQPASDVVSHLIAEGYSNLNILIECVTYGTAGMVTTREFIVMACWHLLTDDDLRDCYQAAGEPERLRILAEIMRLEPVVGHLYRRVQEAITITDQGQTWTLEPGDLVDICVRQTNTDALSVGERPYALHSGRRLAPGVDSSGLSFGAGAHRCPGQSLALLESDVVLRALLQRRPRLMSSPQLAWDDLIAGYTLRGLDVVLESQL